MEDKGGRCVGPTTLSPSCADCFEIWEPQISGTLMACPDLYRRCFTFTLKCSILPYIYNFIYVIYSMYNIWSLSLPCVCVCLSNRTLCVYYCISWHNFFFSYRYRKSMSCRFHLLSLFAPSNAGQRSSQTNTSVAEKQLYKVMHLHRNMKAKNSFYKKKKKTEIENQTD